MSVIINGTTGITSPGGDVSAVDNTVSGLTVGKGGGSQSANVVVGINALSANSTGNYNTAVGNQALAATTVNGNTAVGHTDMNTNTTGTFNAAVGAGALSLNTTGGYNSAFGYTALYSNTTASNNTAVGYQAGYSTTTGIRLTAIGQQAGYSNTTANHNTFIGYQAGYSSNYTSGDAFNTFVGYASGSDVTTGIKNTIIGRYSGNQGSLDIRTLSNYIVLSDGDGNPRGVFDNNGILSVGSSTPAASTYHSFVTGNAGQASFRSTLNTAGKYWYLGADGSATPYFILYNQSAVGVYIAPGGTSWTGTSDESLKENLTPISDGLNKVNSLRAVIGNYISDDEKIKHPFLIAQDVEKVLPEAVSLNPEGKLGLSYTEVIPLLVSAIQELKAEFDAYKATHP